MISAFPNIDPAGYFRSERIDDPILCRKRFFLYSSGRAALYYAMKTAGLPGDSGILLPSFHCGVEVEAVKRAGYHVDFYNVKRDLNIDFEDLAHRITAKTRALIVTHYFGFPQDMERVLEFCHENKLMLLEDCAHSLYSSFREKLTGSFGAFGIYSLRKTIALPNGGGLLCNSPEFPDPPEGNRYFDRHILKSAVRSMLEYKARGTSISGKISYGILSLYASIYGNAAKDIKDITGTPATDVHWYYDVPTFDYHNAISGLSLPLLRKESFKQIVKKRRENYRLINETLSEIPDSVKLSKDIKDGVCPLCYVVNVENRDKIVSEMRKKNVSPFIFGASAHTLLTMNNYPDFEYLSGKLMGLPVHHQLRVQDIEMISEVFIQCVSSNRGAVTNHT